MPFHKIVKSNSLVGLLTGLHDTLFKNKPMNELLAYLSSICPLSQMTKDYLAEHLKTLIVPKKEFILKQGRICYNIYFVNEGLLRCFYIKHEKEINNWFMKEGDVIISVESFFNQLPGYENIQALEDCVLHYIEYNELQYLYNNCPEFNFVGRVLIEKYYMLSEQRLYSLRMQKGVDKYSYIMNNFPQLIQRVPSKYIASYLGITEETLSRIRSLKARN